MLLRAAILVVGASLSAAAPVASVDSSAPASRDSADISFGTTARAGPIDIVDRRDNAGFAVRCFLSTDCQGDAVRSSGDLYYARGVVFALDADVPYGSPISCRLDVWNGWDGEFKVVEAITGKVALDYGSEPISRVQSIYGGGQLCLGGWPPRSKVGTSMGAVAIATRY